MVIASGLQASSDAVIWGLVLIAGIACLGGAVFFIRRRLFSDRQQSPSDGLSLQQLRDMLARGQITDEEFAQLKCSVLGDSEESRSRKDRPDGDLPRRGDAGGNQVKSTTDQSR